MDPAIPSTSSNTEAHSPSTTNSEFEENPNIKRRMYTTEFLIPTYNLAKLVRELGTREQGVAFAEEHGLILKTKECRVHRQPMRAVYKHNDTVGSFICCKRSCKGKRITRAKNTWFADTRLSLPRIYYLIYCFAHRWSHDQVIWEDFVREEHCLSARTISDWYSHCREVIVIYHLDNQSHQGKIGGPGKIVQIDESKFGKRKHSKGKQVEGHWVLGLIEDGSEDLRLEVCPDDKRSCDDLMPLIQKHVEVGTTIHTDCSLADDCLGDYGYIHKKVNRSEPIDPLAENGTHTRTIESQWRVVKNFFAKENYNHSDNFADLCVEYLWRRSVQRTMKDPFVEIIKAVKYVYDPYKPN